MDFPGISKSFVARVKQRNQISGVLIKFPNNWWRIIKKCINMHLRNRVITHRTKPIPGKTFCQFLAYLTVGITKTLFRELKLSIGPAKQASILPVKLHSPMMTKLFVPNQRICTKRDTKLGRLAIDFI